MCNTNNHVQMVIMLSVCMGYLQGLDRTKGKGGGRREDVGASLFMPQHTNRGPGRGSMIAGRSMHNQRIERLRRDVRWAFHIYYNLFYHLEGCGVLDPTSESDLFALHYVYKPRINHHQCQCGRKDISGIASELQAKEHQCNCTF